MCVCGRVCVCVCVADGWRYRICWYYVVQVMRSVREEGSGERCGRRGREGKGGREGEGFDVNETLGSRSART